MILEIDINQIYTIIAVTVSCFVLAVIIYFVGRFMKNTKVTKKDQKQLADKINYDLLVIILGGVNNISKFVVEDGKLVFNVLDSLLVKDNCIENAPFIEGFEIAGNTVYFTVADPYGIYNAFLYNKK
ncbi:MAG: hypothetical protein RSE56_01385 [Bacilli bacterium]